ncbi:30S ribosomal protein S19e [Nanobdella aerobiophila]|uniref:Small ribosomal subunit protein eS19 n=1 Tax=Nanobdella aerobiophila TaxID=2586965 RepID=A0A915ST09_9ARCH|nr:30S ribosomal protein S19e [Nanobdella aerobiophila]BBL45786.1 30S ribosomal protein S19e [Nanobdella aerobiophila]
MVNVLDIPGNIFNKRLAKYLFENYRDKIKPPYWANFVKTGPDRERNPDIPAEEYNNEPGWWYYRAASILRRLYIKGPIGVSRLRKYYGGLRKRGMEPGKFRRGYGKMVRSILQELESAGLVTKILDNKNKGRVITNEGKSILDKLANEIYKDLTKDNKNLVEYIGNL